MVLLAVPQPNTGLTEKHRIIFTFTFLRIVWLSCEVLALVMAALLVFTVYTELSPTEQATARQALRKRVPEGSGRLAAHFLV